MGYIAVCSFGTAAGNLQLFFGSFNIVHLVPPIFNGPSCGNTLPYNNKLSVCDCQALLAIVYE